MLEATPSHDRALAAGQRGRLTLALAILLSVGVASLGCVAPAVAGSTLEGVSLAWHPTDDLDDLEPLDTASLGGERLRVEPFLDLRADKRKVGENTKRAHRFVKRPVTTDDSVGEWVATHFAEVLAERGVEIVEDDASLILSGEIRWFFVQEPDDYLGRSEIYLRLRDSDGFPLAEGIVRAQVERFGRSYRLRNYQEVLSDLVTRSAHAMLLQPRFRRTLDAAGD